MLLTHLSEVIRNNLAQLLSYKDMRALLDRLGAGIQAPDRRHLSRRRSPIPGLQAVLKLLLAERVSIRNLHLILEAIAEIAPHVRRAEQVAEHVRMRMAQQICGDLADGGVLKVLASRQPLGSRLPSEPQARRQGRSRRIRSRSRAWSSSSAREASTAIRERMDQGHHFVLVATPEARPYVRMVVERLFATLPVLSHLEIARGVEIKSLGTIS